jgi:hypothetical protein
MDSIHNVEVAWVQIQHSYLDKKIKRSRKNLALEDNTNDFIGEDSRVVKFTASS